MEHLGVKAEALVVAQACKNSGGTVVAQVERVVKSGSLDPQKVEVPGILVDAVVVVSDMKNHMQTFGTQYNPGFSGEHRMGAAEFTPPLCLPKDHCAPCGYGIEKEWNR